MTETQQTVGSLLREWRQRRRFSQLSLAVEAEISQRHLSFLESGRSVPSRDMVLRLVEHLDVPLRARNRILVAAGYAPVHGERGLEAPEFAAARSVIEALLHGHNPHPALAIDRHWTLLLANKAVGVLTEGVAEHLLQGEVNALRLSLHPEGLAPRIQNFRQWRSHILARLARDADNSADPRLAALLDELKSYPVPARAVSSGGGTVTDNPVAIPLRIDSREGPLEFLSATTVFGTAVDITLSEVVIETFFPANEETAAAMRRLTVES